MLIEKPINKYFDHTVLHSNTTIDIINRFCSEAIEYKFASVCVNPVHVKRVSSILYGSDVLTCTVVGFPLGANKSEVKAFEAQQALLDGADEIDMVINIGALKDGNFEIVKNDIKCVKDAIADRAVLKVIIETCLLSYEEKIAICKIAKELRVDFVKTSSGFSSGGALPEDVKLMKSNIGDCIEVKASTGIKTLEDALVLIENGATRLGSSSGIQITNKYNSLNN